MNEIRKISVVGAGAIGTFFGSMIKRHRPELNVQLICRGEHCQAMQNRGCAELRGNWGSYEVPIQASSDIADAVDSDLVLFTVKTQDTADTARQLASVVGDAIVVSLQNGINQLVLADSLPRNRLLVGMTATNMNTIEPGIVELHRDGVSVIGAATDEVPTVVVEQACEVMSWSGLKIESSEHILGVQYNKLLFNTMGYASVIASLDFIREGILYGPWRKSVAIPLLTEGMEVLEAAGIQLQRVAGGSDVIPLRRLMRVLNTPGLDRLASSLIRPFKAPRLVFSLQRDLIRNRPTEIEFVNGEIVRLAKENGMEACYNEEVVQAVRELEASDAVEFLTRDEAVRRFRRLADS